MTPYALLAPIMQTGAQQSAFKCSLHALTVHQEGTAAAGQFSSQKVAPEGPVTISKAEKSRLGLLSLIPQSARLHNCVINL